MRKLRPRRGRDWILMTVLMEPHKAPVWLHICECSKPYSTELRLMAWSFKVMPVLMAIGSGSPRKVTFS